MAESYDEERGWVDNAPYCEKHGPMAQGATHYYCEDCQHERFDTGKPVDDVMALKAHHADKWQDQPDSYWFARLAQELGELGSSLVGDHDDTPEHELRQIASIALNWLELRLRRRLKYEEMAIALNVLESDGN